MAKKKKPRRVVADANPGDGSSSASSLPALADGINAAHREAVSSARSTLEHALRAGSLLLQVKKRVAHGEWLPWVEINCVFSQRTARGYMRLSANRQRVADIDMPVRQALRFLSEPKSSDDTKRREIAVRVVEEVGDQDDKPKVLKVVRHTVDEELNTEHGPSKFNGEQWVKELDDIASRLDSVSIEALDEFSVSNPELFKNLAVAARSLTEVLWRISDHPPHSAVG